MLRTFFIPVTYKFSRDEAFFAQHHPESRERLLKRREQQTAAREEIEAELNDCLNAGWSVIHSSQVETDSTTNIVVVVHKPD